MKGFPSQMLGFPHPDVDFHALIRDNCDNTVDVPEPPPEDNIQASRHYPIQAQRSGVLSHQPYNTYAPRTTFLQLRTARVHRSVFKASQLLKMSKEEQMLATTSSNLLDNMIDDMIHKVDPAIMMESEDKIKV